MSNAECCPFCQSSAVHALGEAHEPGAYRCHHCGRGFYFTSVPMANIGDPAGLPPRAHAHDPVND